jgi:hypothetical protein
MQAPDPIETALARLMPPALGQNFQLDLEAMIDELAGDEPQEMPVISSFPTRWIIGSGIAAALAGLIAVYPLIQHAPDRQLSLNSEEATPTAPGLVLITGTDRIQSMTDEGWQENADGHAIHAIRLNVVEENSLMDEETGMVVLISQPREEVLHMPISSF